MRQITFHQFPFKANDTHFVRIICPWQIAVSWAPARNATALYCPYQINSLKPGPWFNIKMSSYQYRISHCGDKTVVRSSYLHNGISYTGKMLSLYWIEALGTYICVNVDCCISGVVKAARVCHHCRWDFIWFGKRGWWVMIRLYSFFNMCDIGHLTTHEVEVTWKQSKVRLTLQAAHQNCMFS